MEPTFKLLDALWRPSFVFKHQNLVSQKPIDLIPTSWEDSALNPKNRVQSLPAIGTSQTGSRWRIDGSATFKTRFYAVPLDLVESGRLPPLRIDVFLPDQGKYPPALRQTLDATAGVPLQHAPTVASLGLSRYLCGVLDSYCSRNPSFLTRYLRLPFGSRIIVSNVAPEMSKVDIVIEPNYTLEGLTTSISTLRQTCSNIPVTRWPPTVGLLDLGLVRQLHDSVTLVTILLCKERPELEGTMAIFKSGSDDFHHVLHELSLLLTLPQHPNMIGPPLAIVTKKSSFGGKQGVYGFLIPYLPLGSFRDMLPASSLAQTLDLATKVRWCVEVTSVLKHVLEKGETFFSDLRPDNVLLDQTGRAILCDFEQRGSWHDWCPPEVLYPQYVENLLNHQQGSKTQVPVWDSLIATYSRKRPKKPHESQIHSKNRPWFALSRQSQEKAMVYTLGLFIYCVFEGLSSVSPSLPYRFAIDPDISFPVFRRTPSSIQNLIRQCTSDAPQWHESERTRRRKVIRVGNLLYAAPATYQPSHSEQLAEDVLDAALDWWTTELESAGQFFLSQQWENQEFGTTRPNFQQVIAFLQSFQTDHTPV